MHFTCDIPKNEGIYHVRLYNSSYTTMEQQRDDVFDEQGNSLGIEVDGDLVFEDSFGDAHAAYENELLQSLIGHDNWKISLEADPVLQPLVDAIRDTSSDIWLEVTLEQKVLGLGDLRPFVMAQPRKERMIWWGKLKRNEAAGFSDYQSYKSDQPLVKVPERKLHVGGLDLTFVHWLHDRCTQSAEDFLDHFRTNYHQDAMHLDDKLYATAFDLLYDLVKYLSPTQFIGLSDKNLHDWHDGDFDDASIVNPDERYNSGICTQQFQMSYTMKEWGGIGATTNRLPYILIPVMGNSLVPGTDGYYSPYFLKASDTSDNTAGEASLYTRWPTLGDALFTLTREFFLKVEVELPTLRELDAVYRKIIRTDINSESKNDIGIFWAAASRWAMMELDDYPIKVTPQAQEKSVKYDPMPVWVHEVKISQPNPGNKFYESAGGTLHKVEQPVDGILSYTPDGKDVTYTTLFRFMGWELDSNTQVFFWTADFLGLRMFKPGYFPGTVETVSLTASDGSLHNFSSWGHLHWWKVVDLWGGARAIVEFDHEGVGLEAFPDSTRPFGFLDWSDFGALRYFEASPGLLFSGKQYGIFSIIEITRTPGGDSHIKGIERKVVTPQNIPPDKTQPDNPTPPAPPVINPPPTITTENICGSMLPLVFGISYTGTICSVSVKVDGVTQSGAIIGSAGGGNITPIFVTINFCALTVGPHTICVTVTPCITSVAPVTTCWNFTVNHTCC